MTQGIRVTLGVLALCLIVLLIVVSKQMANSRTLREEVDTVRHTLTTSQQQGSRLRRRSFSVYNSRSNKRVPR